MDKRTCSIEDCDDPVCARGWCSKHYQAWKRHGDPLGFTPERLCEVAGCGEKHKALGCCNTHYLQWRKENVPRPECTFPECGNPVDSHGLCPSHAAQLRAGKELLPLGTPRPRPVRVKALCIIDDCPQVAYCRGWCRVHYQHWQRHGDPLGSGRGQRRRCSIEGCGGVHYGRGWCRGHWQKWRAFGDPLAVRQVRNTCSIEGCGEPSHGHGYCRVHYANWNVNGDPLDFARRRNRPGAPAAPCTLPGCREPQVSRGWCKPHYMLWFKHGDPLWTAPERTVRLCSYPGCDARHRAYGYCDSHAAQVRNGRPAGPILAPSERRRRYSLNQSYFDEITDERRAYWLGFITADGCVHRSDRKASLSVMLKASDSGHLQTLCDDLGSDRPVLFYRNEATVSFPSVPLADALERLGVTPRKSATVRPWNGSTELMPHYWRGLIDGDGSLGRVRSRPWKWTVSLVGSEACVNGFAAWAREVCGSTSTVSPKPGCYSWAVAGNAKPTALARALYSGATVALPRKLELAQQLITGDLRSAA